LYANEQANAIVEGQKRAVFTENMAFQAYEIEHGLGMELSFSIYDSAAVTRLLREQPELLPRRIINGIKDMAWNRTKIANCIIQGIIQGESIPTIAQRIARETSSSNMHAMIRYARTAMTGAQNAGRMEMLREAQQMGIDVKKKWLATLDGRTRDAHRALDGQVQEVEKPFKSELGDIMYPGDFQAHPANVYNCRCTLVYEYPKYLPQNAERRAYNNPRSRESELIPDMTYREWRRWRMGGR
jgi:SPP1 gp7 family putative phage head morphogenesis protein